MHNPHCASAGIRALDAAAETNSNSSSNNSQASGRRTRRASLGAALLCGLAALTIARMGSAGSARDYLNTPIDTWLTFYNFG
jgi:hypothetical protein